jgi:exopolyphosphatase / guanosine-5'-triphosphate,3'-diphosphate pyrophosphatase
LAASHRARRGPWARPRGGPPGALTYAALDLGTNNCRLLVARPAKGGFQVVDAFSRIVRLGEGLSATGRLSDAAMERALTALRVCADKLRRRNVERLRGVATEACRRADNGQAFLERVSSETGISFDIISPREEVDLALLGCVSLIEGHVSRLLVFDIGGGSTELSLVEVQGDGRLKLAAWASLPCGVIGLAEEFGGDRIAPEDFERMVAKVSQHLAPLRDRQRTDGGGPCDGLQVVGTSGTVTTLAGLHLALPAYDRRRVDGLCLEFGELCAVTDRLLGMDYAARATLPCVGPERADLVVGGCAILEAIRRAWPVKRLHIADRGLREGILLRLMAADGAPCGHAGLVEAEGAA